MLFVVLFPPALMTVLDVGSSKLEFRGHLDGPFSESKFVVRRDPDSPTPRYYAASNDVTGSNAAQGLVFARNNLVLSTSDDLLEWQVCSTILRDDSEFDAITSAWHMGFQYPDFQFDRLDMLVAIRTAYRGAVQGCSNRETALRVADFRSVCARILASLVHKYQCMRVYWFVESTRSLLSYRQILRAHQTKTHSASIGD